MKKNQSLTLFCVIAIVTFGALLTSELAIAKKHKNKTKICYPETYTDTSQNPGNHPSAYADGYRQGQQNRWAKNSYEPRAAGGEFGRGFDDGYWDRPYDGQRYVVPDTVQSYTTMQCERV